VADAVPDALAGAVRAVVVFLAAMAAFLAGSGQSADTPVVCRRIPEVSVDSGDVG